MVVAGGQRQPADPNVPAAALKLILPAVQPLSRWRPVPE